MTESPISEPVQTADAAPARRPQPAPNNPVAQEQGGLNLQSIIQMLGGAARQGGPDINETLAQTLQAAVGALSLALNQLRLELDNRNVRCASLEEKLAEAQQPRMAADDT